MTETALHGIRVFLMDDHPAVREGLSLLLTDKGLVICVMDKLHLSGTKNLRLRAIRFMKVR